MFKTVVSGNVFSKHFGKGSKCAFLERLADCPSGKADFLPFQKGRKAAFLERPKNTLSVMNHNSTPAFLPFWKGRKAAFLEREKSSLSRKAKKEGLSYDS